MDKQLFQAFAGIFGLSKYENRQAVAQGYEALEQFNRKLQAKGKEVIDMLIEENRIGIVLLGRAYHNDPGLNHGILEQLQALGYPILTQDALPQHGDETEDLFAHDINNKFIDHHLSIDDVWNNSYSENTNRKVWGAKYTARHPNLVALELSSFKCGHDAPIYSVIEQIIEKSGTPYFCFKDLDENKPAGSIKIRLETIDYFLKRYQESMFGGNNVTAAEENLRVSFA
jgi:predicted nucleotide-binding protein (sugar kinase/HSP70/actin superfamily)